MFRLNKPVIFLSFIISLIWITPGSAEYLENQPLPDPGWPGIDLSGSKCFGRGIGYGPFDYTNPNHRGHNLRIVESAHFTKEIETLAKGNTTYIWADIDYTLRAFPNHHRALYAMARYQMINPSSASNSELPSVECYYQRALKFKPDDFRVMLLYANYLTKKEKPEMAVEIYKKGLSQKNAPPQINYSLGLLYFEIQKFDEAVEQAKIAYNSGIKKSKLARKLKEINRWPIN